MNNLRRQKRVGGWVARILGLLLCAAMTVAAQDATPQQNRRPVDSPGLSQRDSNRRRPGINRRTGRPGTQSPTGYNAVLEEMRIDEETIRGAPYAATAVTESVQTLGDGTRITNRITARLWRDGEGRMRREQSLNFAGPFTVASSAASGAPQQVIIINDVVTRQRYVLEPEARKARRLRFGQGPAPLNLAPPDPAQGRVETLGKKTLEGLTVEGTRSTITIPAGQIGNDRPIHIVSERWTSPELKAVIASRHQDPRIGETTYRLTGIRRQEPDKVLFEIPTDYQIRRIRLRTGPGRIPGRREVRDRDVNR